MHKKTKRLNISDNVQLYLLSELLTTDEKILLFKLKCKMIELKGNFSQMYKNSERGLICIMCEIEDTREIQSHIYQCSYFLSHPTIGPSLKAGEYDDIYGTLSQQIKAVKLWKEVIEARNMKLLLSD